MLEIIILLVFVALIAVFGPEKGHTSREPDHNLGASPIYVPGPSSVMLSTVPVESMHGSLVWSRPHGASKYAIPRKQKKKVHFSETRSERIFDVKSRKILRDRLGKT